MATIIITYIWNCNLVKVNTLALPFRFSHIIGSTINLGSVMTKNKNLVIRAYLLALAGILAGICIFKGNGHLSQNMPGNW